MAQNDLLTLFKKRFAANLDRRLVKILLEGFNTKPQRIWLEWSSKNKLLVCYYLPDFDRLVRQYGWDSKSLERNGKQLKPYCLKLFQSTHCNKNLPKKWAVVASSDRSSVSGKKRSRSAPQYDDDYVVPTDPRKKAFSVQVNTRRNNPFGHLTEQDFAEIDLLFQDKHLTPQILDDIAVQSLQMNAPHLPNPYKDW